MGRPKKNNITKPADERLIDAFWEALALKPLGEVTVAELCRRAGCNKTTFYYHFDTLDDLVFHIEESYETLDFPSLLAAAAFGGKATAKKDELVSYFGSDIERARLLLGPGGDPSFSQRIQAAARARWCEFLGVEESKLDPYDALLLRHAMGGTVAMLAAPDVKVDYRLLLQVIVDVMEPQVDRMIAKYGKSL